MTTTTRTADRAAVRNRALLAAEDARAKATRDAELEYSETVSKLRERFESDLAEAAAIRLARVTPAHRAYIAAVIAAEHGSWNTSAATR